MAAGKYQPLTLTPINFSLTEGTAIPAPPDSPPDTPRPPTPGKGPLSSHPTPKSATFQPSALSQPPKESTDLHKTSTNDDASSMLSPTSPSFSKRPSSVRKFLGLRPLSSSDSLRSERPGSPGTIDSKQSLSRKKSGSWFNRRKSAFVIGSVQEGKENQTPRTNGERAASVSNGPPAPALPELKSLGVSEDAASLGAEDIFKNIK